MPGEEQAVPRNREDLGLRVREIRERRGFTQEQLAEASDLSPDTIGRLERGNFSPSFDTMCKLAEGLNVPRAVLMVEDYDEADDLAVLIRRLPQPFRALAVSLLGALSVQAALGPSGVE